MRPRCSTARSPGRPRDSTCRPEGKRTRVNGAYVSGRFFEVLGVAGLNPRPLGCALNLKRQPGASATSPLLRDEKIPPADAAPASRSGSAASRPFVYLRAPPAPREQARRFAIFAKWRRRYDQSSTRSVGAGAQQASGGLLDDRGLLGQACVEVRCIAATHPPAGGRQSRFRP